MVSTLVSIYFVSPQLTHTIKTNYETPGLQSRDMLSFDFFKKRSGTSFSTISLIDTSYSDWLYFLRYLVICEWRGLSIDIFPKGRGVGWWGREGSEFSHKKEEVVLKGQISLTNTNPF